MNAAYKAAADALRELGDRFAALADNTALDGAKAPYISIGVLPGHIGAHAGNAAIIDAVAQALIGKAGKDEGLAADGRRWKADGQVGRVYVSVHGIVPDPAREDLRAENARLRAELAALRADGGETS